MKFIIRRLRILLGLRRLRILLGLRRLRILLGLRRLRILLGLGCLLAGTFPTADATPGPGHFVDVIGVRVTDVKGRQHRIGVSTGKVGAAALVFLDTACPVATRYIPALNALHDDAQARGVSLYGVLSNPDIGWRESVDFVDDFGVEFPVIVDSAGDLAVRLGPHHYDPPSH